MGLGEAFSLASAATWALAVILFKRSGETFSATALNVFKNALAVVLLVPTVALFEAHPLPPMAARDWAVMIVSGLLGIAIADNLYLAALNTMGASRTGIAGMLYSPSVILLSFLLLGERLALLQWAGLALVIGAVGLVSWRGERREISAAQLRRGTALAVGGVVLMALGVVLVKPVLENGPFLFIVLVRVAAGLGGLLGLALLRNRLGLLHAEFRRRHDWCQAAAASILGTYLAMMLWLAGYKYTQASVASVLNETAAVFIVLLAWLLLGEPLGPRKLAGVLAAFAGVAVMLLGG